MVEKPDSSEIGYTRIVSRLSSEVSGTVSTDVKLAPLTTFGIGGNAAVLVVPQRVEDVVATIEVCRESEVPLFVMGAGSNIIVPDEGVHGIVLRMSSVGDCSPSGALSFEGGLLTAWAGVKDRTLSEYALARSITGFEWICDIPGSVGGAVFMNAGNNDGETADSLIRVKWVDPSGKVHDSPRESLAMGYRSSIFHTVPGIIVEATFDASRKDHPDAIRTRMEGIRAMRKRKFPVETLCAGSVFKRPPGHFAGKLIEDAGCGGMRCGGAMVSNHHKGFIVNTGGATAADVLNLMGQVRRRVFETFGITLEPEIEVFGSRPFPI